MKKNKYKVMIYFIQRMIEEKNIYDIGLLMAYCMVYYNLSKNSFIKSINLMLEKELIMIKRNLEDCRKKIVLLNFG